MTREEILEKYKKDKNLRSLNLHNANLQYANLHNANLRGANLCSTILSNVKNLSAMYKSNLNILKFQKGRLRAFKYLDEKNESPYQRFQYEVGKKYFTNDYDIDERELCSSGFNVATLDWCLRDTHCDLSKTYIIVEFDAKDIVAIPYNSDGKFRVKRLKVIRKLKKEELKKAIGLLYPTNF